MSNMTRIGLLVFTGVVTCATVLAQEKCEIAITFPGADGKVGAEDTVKGKARNLPNGAHLWVLTHRKGIGLWWPQGGGEGAIEKGEWNVFVTFGEARDQGRQFEILAVVVDEPTHANLN